MEPTLKSIVDAASTLQWVFVGGKGGVGKTTTSCALATQLAATPVTDSAGATRERKVLLLSTDPAHNLSDAFNQQFTKEPSLVQGTTNLFAMESDPQSLMQKMQNPFAALLKQEQPAAASADAASTGPLSSLFKTLAESISSMPGVDELTVFAAIMKDEMVRSFDVVVFDTAPTGHTLRLLSVPQNVGAAFDRVAGSVSSGSGSHGNIFLMVQQLVTLTTGMGQSDIAAKLQKWRESVRLVQTQLQDAAKTCFVCVCIPEFLSVYETDRLVLELSKHRISCSHVVVNQLVMRLQAETPCRMCTSRQKIQTKYLGQIDELFGEDFHIVRMPLHTDEVRGLEALRRFGFFLMTPYNVETHGYI